MLRSSTTFARSVTSLGVLLPVAVLTIGCSDAPYPLTGAGGAANTAGTGGTSSTATLGNGGSTATSSSTGTGGATNSASTGTGGTGGAASTGSGGTGGAASAGTGGAASTGTGGGGGSGGSGGFGGSILDSGIPDGSMLDGAVIDPAPVALGTAGNYVVLAESKIANVPVSKITGDVALSPEAATFITGFAMTKAGTKWTSLQVVGSIFAADNDPPTPITLTTAVADMLLAYTDAAGRPTPAFLNLNGGAIGGLTLTPGLYKWTSTVTVPSDVVISGTANDTWIFQISGDLTMSAAKKMTLIGGAQAKNIVWQVAGMVDLGTTSHFEGIILSKTAITLETGASINGRLLAQTAVNLGGSTITAPAP